MDESTQQRITLRERPEVPIAIDPAKPDGRTADGLRYWDVRCAIPVQLDCPEGFRRVDPIGQGAQGQGEGFEVHTADDQHYLIEGIASSTSTDFYETEMSRGALEHMAQQMAAGVAYVPTHWESEWHQQIGATVSARVDRAQVARPADDGEQQYVLRVLVMVDRRTVLGAKLEQRLADGKPIGQSIGGWFTEIRLIADDQGEIERVIIERVELDHLAVTRSPANPDSWITVLRSRIERAVADTARDGLPAALRCTWGARTVQAGVQQRPEPGANLGLPSAPQQAPEPEAQSGAPLNVRQATTSPPNVRHVVDVIDEGDTVVVRFQKAMSEAEHGEEAEPPPARLFSQEAPMEQRGATPFADLPLDTESDWSWDTDASDEVLGDDDWARYKQAHAWFDPDAQETKAGYKLPIAKMKDGTLTAYLRGVQAAVAALNGARGGVDIPDEDREPTYNHLVRYYDKAGEEAPPLRAAPSPDEVVQPPAEPAHVETDGVNHEADAALSEPTPETIGDEMDKELADKLLSAVTTLNSSVDALAERMTARSEPIEPPAPPAPAQAPAPAPDPRDAELAALRSQVAEQEGLIREMAERPQRRGVRTMHAPTAGQAGFWARSVERMRELGHRALSSVIDERMQGRLSTDYSGVKSRSAVEADLRAVLEAGAADGLIRDPNDRPSWN